MRISDWSSDVCSSDLCPPPATSGCLPMPNAKHHCRRRWPTGGPTRIYGDRKSVVQGKSVSVRVDLGGRRIIKKKKNKLRNKILEHRANIKKTKRRSYTSNRDKKRIVE